MGGGEKRGRKQEMWRWQLVPCQCLRKKCDIGQAECTQSHTSTRLVSRSGMRASTTIQPPAVNDIALAADALPPSALLSGVLCRHIHIQPFFSTRSQITSRPLSCFQPLLTSVERGNRENVRSRGRGEKRTCSESDIQVTMRMKRKKKAANSNKRKENEHRIVIHLGRCLHAVKRHSSTSPFVTRPKSNVTSVALNPSWLARLHPGRK